MRIPFFGLPFYPIDGGRVMLNLLYKNKPREYTIEKGCPWYEAQQTYEPPNVNWCEPTVCSVINEPANTWSNVGFFIVAVAVAKKINNIAEKTLSHFAWVFFAMGFFSFTYHATNNYYTQFFDFIGMYLMTSMYIAINIKRLKGQEMREYQTWFWFLMFFNTTLFWMFDFWDIAIQQTIILHVLFILISEIIVMKREGMMNKSKYFWVGLVAMFIAQTFSQLDLKRIWCEPNNTFLHGHAIWHVFSAVGMLFVGLHMREVLKHNPKRS
jgi:hypothetical protein